MKKPPYHEIINLKEERNEYAKLCSGKSKKFKLYTEWEAHIKELLADSALPRYILGRNARNPSAYFPCSNTRLRNHTKQETCKRKLLFQGHY